jgi:hypothetical protein
VALLRDDDASERRAHLAGHDALGARDRRRDGRDVGIVEHHGGRLATELQRAARDALTTQRRDLASRRGRAGEGDLVDARVGDEKLRHLTVGGHQVEHARRQADLLDGLGDEVALAGRLG